MAKVNFKQYTFKSVLLNQLFIAIAVAFAISLPLTGIPAYFALNHTINSDIETLEKESYDSVNEHLNTGWQPYNIDKVYQQLRERMPGAALFLQKAPQFLDPDEDDIVDPSTPTTATFKRLIEDVQRNERLIVETNILNSTINAAIPIKFQNQCLVCHSQEVKTGAIYAGALAGTMVLQVPMSINQISATSTIGFFLAFLLIFIAVATVITNKLIQTNLLVPLAGLNERVKRLRLSSHEQHIDWQRTPQMMVEIDQIDESISQHIQTIHGIYDKLDALVVTEHETGLFHKERFNEVIRYELFRSHRYQHPFSLLLIKLVSVKILNATAKNIEAEEPGSKYMVFGQILHNDTRETDMAFRLEEHIFAIVAPETDEAGAEVVKKDIYHRLINSEIPADIQRSIARPEYEFTIQMGHSTYQGDDSTAKDLLKAAVASMRESEEQVGRYPPLTDNG
ncbi:diguanylate cyclase domain-containing protein [Thiomicrorhabdus sp. Kp2]|uniref:GGDEF domain-containing protein n=1 Tax=Thiomicrorhabdus sp. Kp2 TaxID=1123518 RepID=UPI0004006DC4|nr:diguanylate cyclase [Thiomicrorhabdus sp. Kp2]